MPHILTTAVHAACVWGVSMVSFGRVAATCGLLLASAGLSHAQDATGWFRGDWYLTVGATGMVAPDFEGARDYMFRASPIISLGKAGPEARFTSRNDNISLALVDEAGLRAGVTGKLLFSRDQDDSPALRGLEPIRWGGEAGGFIEFYPADWMRVRVEARHGIRSHDGIVGDLAVDAFHDVSETVRVSAGPRLSFASKDYFEAYYGVTPAESVASGLTPFEPESGIRSAGVGGAVTWKVNEKTTTSLFGEYSRLMGSAADSSLVRERGSRDQFTVGVSGTYRFDFNL